MSQANVQPLHGRSLRLLVSEAASRSYAPDIAQIDPTVELVVMRQDGSLSSPQGSAMPAGASDIDIAWVSIDLYTQGGPASSFVQLATRAPSLRWFASPAAATDDPIFRQLLKRSVRVTNTHVQSAPISEYVLRSALEHFQGAELWRTAQNQREWRPHRFRELAGSTWLIIGFGAIGADVAKRARAFGAITIGVRRSPGADELADEMIHPDLLSGAVGRADVIVLAAPSTPATKDLVDAEFLTRAGPNTLLVNVGRGALVDEDALLNFLNRNTEAAAVLDVTKSEPLPVESPLWTHPRVAVTPHNAALGNQTPGRAARFFLDNLTTFLRDGTLTSEVRLHDLAPDPPAS